MAVLPVTSSSRRGPSAVQWDAHRQVITRLYSTKNKTLREVMHYMDVHHNFVASEKMYKKRIAAWGLDKKFKKHEAVAMLVLLSHHKAQGKSPVFRIRGRDVQISDLMRYAKRANVTLRDLHGLTPVEAFQMAPDLVCSLSNELSRDVKAPDQLQRFEILFSATKVYIESAIDSKLCWFDHQGFLCWDLADEEWQEVRKVPYLISLGNSMFRNGEMQIAGSAWRSAFAGLEAVVRCVDPMIWFEILLSRHECLIQGSEQVSIHMGQYISSLVGVLLRPNAPHRLLAHSVSSLDVQELRAVIPSYCELLQDIWRTVLSPVASLEKHLQAYMIGLPWRMNAGMELIDPAILLTQFNLSMDQLDGWTLMLYLFARWTCANICANDEKAAQVAMHMVEVADRLPAGPCKLQARMDALQCFARSCLTQGDCEQASWLLEQIHNLNDEFHQRYGACLTVELETYDIYSLLDSLSDYEVVSEPEQKRAQGRLSGLDAIQQRLADELAIEVGELALETP